MMILQHIVTDLFSTCPELADRLDPSQKTVCELYFNAFSPVLWDQALQYHFNYSCHLTYHGTGTLQVNAVQEDGSTLSVAQREVNGPASLYLPLANLALYYYVSHSPEVILEEGYFACETGKELPDPLLKVCLISVTYQRPKEIAELSGSFLRFQHLPTYRKLAPLLDMLIVNNNGENPLILPPCHRYELASPRSLASLKNAQATASLLRDHVTLLNACNTGGSGGFIRGIRHALQQGNYTHVLLCDDDAYLHPETLYRTLALLCLREGTQQGLSARSPSAAPCIISGAMFEKEAPHYCHCVLEKLNARGHHQIIIGQQDLNASSQSLNQLITKLRNSLTSAKSIAHQYAAWWYCCIPVSLIKEHGLPLQFFIRGDDQEYGLRLKAPIVTLNGIQIWHPAFKNKKNAFRAYLGNRNYALINLLHYESYLNNIAVHFIVKAIRALRTGDLETLSLLSLSLEGALRFDNREIIYDTLLERVKEGMHRDRISSLYSLLKSLLILTFKGNGIRQALINKVIKVQDGV